VFEPFSLSLQLQPLPVAFARLPDEVVAPAVPPGLIDPPIFVELFTDAPLVLGKPPVTAAPLVATAPPASAEPPALIAPPVLVAPPELMVPPTLVEPPVLVAPPTVVARRYHSRPPVRGAAGANSSPLFPIRPLR